MIRLRAIVSLAVAFTLVAAPTAAATPSPAAARVAEHMDALDSTAAACGGIETVQLQTFKVEMEAGARRYEVGESARFHVTVHRQLPQNPAGTGLYYESPYQEPAEEIPVGVGLRIGNAYLYNFGITDSKGHTTIGIRLKPHTPAGWATATAFASKTQFQSPCANVVEVGYTALPKAFKATRPGAGH